MTLLTDVQPVAMSNAHNRMDTDEFGLATPRPAEAGRLVTAPFLLAVGLLGIAVILSGPVAKWKNFKAEKKPIDLREPLAAFPVDVLKPYEVRKRVVLDPTIIDALDTESYLSWTLEDPTVPANGPLRIANLFITYYTGRGALVPHTPDVCYLGSGYQPGQPHGNTTIDVPSLKPPSRSVPLRVCTFVKTAVFDRDKVSVVYTFHANGQFTSTRDGVRVIINNPSQTFAYFSKVEVSFPRATREQSVEGAAKLFDRILPVLVERHWPDLNAAEADSQKTENP